MDRNENPAHYEKEYDAAHPDLKSTADKMKQSRARAAVSWFFIILTIVIIQFTIYSRSSEGSYEESADSIQIQISGKYFIGLKQLAAQNPVMGKNLSQLEQGIKNSQGQGGNLAYIPILAELSGRDAALKELERMAASPDEAMDADNIKVFYDLYRTGSESLGSKQLSVLKDYGWIGRLALSQDKPDSDPEREAVLKSAVRLAVLAGLMTIVVVGALLAGVTLFIIAIVQRAKGNLKSHLVMPENPGGLLLETFAIYLVLSIVLPLLITLIAPGYKNGGIIMSVIAGFLPMLWPLLLGAGWKECRTALGWHRGKGIFREVGAGILGYITGLPLMGAALVVVMVLARFVGTTPSHPAVFDLSRTPLYLFLLAVIYAPFVEETLFRGALYGYLRRSLPWAVSAVIASFIFAILHPQGWVAVPVIGVIGFNLSAIREWRGSAIASMTAHAMNNGSLVLILMVALA